MTVPGIFDRGPGSGRLDPNAFLAFGAFCERAVPAGTTRVLDRHGEVHTAAVLLAPALADAWFSPVASQVGDALGGYLTMVQRAEPAGTEAFRALADLGAKARAVGRVIAEVEPIEKSWIEQFVANWSEIQDKITTGIFQNERAEELRQRYDNERRRADAASERRRQALLDWHNTCGVVAGVLARSKSVLEQLPAGCPAELRPPSARTPDAVRDFVRQRWADGVVARFVERNSGNSDELRSWWKSLSPQERKVLFKTRPDLVDRYLRPFLSDAERFEFDTLNRFIRSETQAQFELKMNVTLPASPDDPLGATVIPISATVTATKTINSDGTVDVRFEFKLAAGVLIGGVGSRTDVGGEGKYSITLRFASDADYEAARDKLADAQRPEGWLAAAFKGGDARKAVEDAFGKSVGYEYSVGAVANMEQKFNTAGLALEAKESLGAGYFDDNVKGQHGLYLRGKVSVTNPGDRAKTTGELAADGKLYFTDDGRRYLSLKVTAEGGNTADVLKAAGLSDQALAMLKGNLAGGTGVAATLKLEVTDANFDEVTGLLRDLGERRLAFDRHPQLARDVDVTVLLTGNVTGKAGIKGPELVPGARPQSALGELGGSVKHVETGAAYRKPPGGELYRMDD